MVCIHRSWSWWQNVAEMNVVMGKNYWEKKRAEYLLLKWLPNLREIRVKICFDLMHWCFA